MKVKLGSSRISIKPANPDVKFLERVYAYSDIQYDRVSVKEIKQSRMASSECELGPASSTFGSSTVATPRIRRRIQETESNGMKKKRQEEVEVRHYTSCLSHSPGPQSAGEFLEINARPLQSDCGLADDGESHARQKKSSDSYNGRGNTGGS